MSEPGAGTSITELVAGANLLDSPQVVTAIENFVVEAIEEATDLLRTGDMATRTQLIRVVMSMALKSRDVTPDNEAAEILEKARSVVGGVLDD